MAGKITTLKFQKKNKERVNVYLDGKYAFSLQAILAARLHKGQTLSDEEIEGLLQEDAFQKAYDKTLNFLTYRPRSRAEVRRYLQHKGVTAVSGSDKQYLVSGLGFLQCACQHHRSHGAACVTCS